MEASRGCPFSCNFCVLTGHEQYRYRPIDHVIRDIRDRMVFNERIPGLTGDTFAFLDNNLGGSPRYLRELCEALMPLKKIWGCALTFNVLRDPELVRLMGLAGCRYVYTGLESLNPESISSMNKGQNKLSEVREVIQRAFASGIVLSFGLLVGADGDTNEYLERVPEYLHDLGDHCPTFLGIVCPYPETPFFAQVAAEGRLLPGVTSRDLDGYTLCHRPARLHPSEAIEHFQRLSRTIGRGSTTWRSCSSARSRRWGSRGTSSRGPRGGGRAASRRRRGGDASLTRRAGGARPRPAPYDSSIGL
ncbi:radical SAM protein [Sorangium sp. So ce136]|uniref:B12-binding domain-containing radical SAM protein n=1 Tax=Sorangium sp. So ce136 TaxID=3133284 RepID=UPI003F01159E